MFSLRQKQRFTRDVTQAVRSKLCQTLGEADGAETFAAYATVVDRSPGLEGMPSDLIERFRKARMSVDEAALSHLDAAVTEIKRWTKGVGERPDVIRVMTLMERAIDRMFLDAPGRFVPRNGHAGPSLDDFTRDWQPN